MKLLTALELSFTAGPFFSNLNSFLSSSMDENEFAFKLKYYYFSISKSAIILSMLEITISSLCLKIDEKSRLNISITLSTSVFKPHL